jgi:hypothetical protein
MIRKRNIKNKNKNKTEKEKLKWADQADPCHTRGCAASDKG